MEMKYGAGYFKSDRDKSNRKYDNLQKLKEKCTSRNTLRYILTFHILIPLYIDMIFIKNRSILSMKKLRVVIQI